MRLGNLTTGQPFKVALRALLVFLLIYTVASVLLVRAVKDTLSVELKTQTEAEILLLSEIFEAEGKAGLIATLNEMERAIKPPERVAGLIDQSGFSLTGPISVLPDFVGVTERQITAMTGGAISGSYFLNVRKLDRMSLIVGRNGAPVDRATQRLIIGLAVVGLTIGAIILGLGLWASRTSLARLDAMDAALRRVAEGETDARLPILSRNDQFDRVSVRMNHKLDRLSRLMGGMKATASAIAHDLKTPLSHTQIALNEAADAVESGGDPLPKIEAALGEVENLNSVFDSMLRITRIQANPDKSRFTSVDLRKLAEDVVEFMRPFADEQQQGIVLQAADVQVPGDAPMIKQALVNLVKNASVHAGTGARITVGLEGQGDHICLSVEDNGPGIPEGDREKVLEPFTRLDRARTTPGSGLGLALVQAVCEHHNADLSLSDAQPGLRVAMFFPKFKNI
ncbi:HAMP domain-containing sensor histidine kinase [Aliiroseovarius sp. 2305UL8-7]|uniref:HAMP domain-containing sensor histidine kinase n=1 Tax=Aliiroseovarius conchicola TaxID=3121637 RepID=UPI003526E59F